MGVEREFLLCSYYVPLFPPAATGDLQNQSRHSVGSDDDGSDSTKKAKKGRDYMRHIVEIAKKEYTVRGIG